MLRIVLAIALKTTFALPLRFLRVCVSAGAKITLGGQAEGGYDDDGYDGPSAEDPTDTFNFGRGVSAPADVAALLLRAEEPRGFGRADLLAAHAHPVCVAGYFPGSGKLLTADLGGAVKVWPAEHDARGAVGWVRPLQEWQLPRAVPSVVPAQAPDDPYAAKPRGDGGGPLPAGVVPWLTYFRKKPSDGVDVMRREVVYRDAEAEPGQIHMAHQRSFEVTTGRLLATARLACQIVPCPAAVVAAEMAPSGDVLAVLSVDGPAAAEGQGWRHFSAFLLRAGSLVSEPAHTIRDQVLFSVLPAPCSRFRISSAERLCL